MTVGGPSNIVQYNGSPAIASMPVITAPKAIVAYARNRMIGAYRLTSIDNTIASTPNTAYRAEIDRVRYWVIGVSGNSPSPPQRPL